MLTTDEAVKVLEDHKIAFEHDFGWNRTVLEALDVAIVALNTNKELQTKLDQIFQEQIKECQKRIAQLKLDSHYYEVQAAIKDIKVK